uniref:Histone deacetylase domain-containing protein n=1 Tax=Chromera velia CCMP2878 TaxID=1169474 RepID=A0A0G4FVG4_9ALVE|eukprot:Cvel_18993.t1-p1 / transcript=Cvel_18993.t1 / gene=Cvel_18993 / organism=Chromera_velia_CCMP2878 / gene_product=Histone deacetylase-like amidohydrolase, putative / transcript_product=Histone deacetylase-like amidohydrolase, putative / location=Cvel_scaffold1607:20732-27885(-) / protein_length=428 / sequence_SO=supercontig / SO=protein_coding / is_pseudo=false
MTEHRTLYLWSEWFFWHDAGSVSNLLKDKFVQPVPMWEGPEAKRRIHNLLLTSGLFQENQKGEEKGKCGEGGRALVARHLTDLHPETDTSISAVHTEEHVSLVRRQSFAGGQVGEETVVAANGYDIARLAVSAVLEAVDSLVKRQFQNAYALVRPPGHHACSDRAMGFCMFNNVAAGVRYFQKVAASGALKKAHSGEASAVSKTAGESGEKGEEKTKERVAVVDFDVHHGNGTQEIFWDDPTVLLVSVHQADNYPPRSGRVGEEGGRGAEGTKVNVPLPPGSGSGAYQAVFTRIVLPALRLFRPSIIFVSCGFDGSYMDPLGKMMLSSEDFRWMTAQLVDSASELSEGRLVVCHEGGYSDIYCPYCGLATVEALAGLRSAVQDPFLEEVNGWGYQELQKHQEEVIDATTSGALAKLQKTIGSDELYKR